ncbi:unnamed protein product [Symbiodinium necroappetens]|uniref:Pentatricopeptide repeat-containing protein, chloroplastic n=1 Tax=Symbiodinium necroappetens TaxID=1628268 RepID=A0A812L075_9DINO|nr:unnamed protein product [Symbiodinium necroappetens]
MLRLLGQKDTFAQLVQAAAWPQAVQLLSESGSHANIITFNATATACARGRQWKVSLDLVQEMLRRGIEPSPSTWGAQAAACERGRFMNVTRVLKLSTPSLMGNCGVGSCIADEGELTEEVSVECVELVDVADGVPQAQSREWRPSHPASSLLDVEFGDPRDALMELEDVDVVADEGSRPNCAFAQQLHRRTSAKVPVQSLNALFPQLPLMLAKHLAMPDFLPLRAACTQQREGLPSTALVERLVNFIEPSKADVFLAFANLLMAKRRGESEEDFWKHGTFPPHIREGQASLRTFLTGLDFWHTVVPGAVSQVAQNMREFCFDPRKEVADSAQMVMVVAARQCFSEGESEYVRHLFVEDMIAILLRADDKIRLQACVAFASCGPKLLGTHNPAVTDALIHLCCTSTRSDCCQSMCLKALKVFLDYDRALCSLVEPRLDELEKLRSLGPHEEMAVADIKILCTMEAYCESLRHQWLAAEDLARNMLTMCRGGLAFCCQPPDSR